jgi:ATP-dependent HslUV protease subunit HslV
MLQRATRRLLGATHIQHAQWRSTTVLCVRKGDEVVIMADGQVTSGSHILKPNVKKTRVLQGGSSDTAPATETKTEEGATHDDASASPRADVVIAGFAGATADAFTLFERLEAQLEQHPGQLMRAAVELATMWRMDKYLRRLDASLIVADKDVSLQLTGNGDVVEPHDGVLSIGSGSPYAVAAARALVESDVGLDAGEIAERAMRIAAASCVYTNEQFTTLKIHKGTLEA